MPADNNLKMKTFLFILLVFAFISSMGQKALPKDAVYKSQKSDCAIVYDKSVIKKLQSSDTFYLLLSDKGKLSVIREDFGISLRHRNKKYNFTETALEKDSLILFLFLNDILNYDNLLKSATADRTAISQYGDTINTTLHVDCSTIKLYDIVWTGDIKTKKTKTFTFDINFIFENNPYSIYHFYLTVETDKKISNIKQILSTTPKLKCLRYSGFEI
jgi:hypothetical protein